MRRVASSVAVCALALVALVTVSPAMAGPNVGPLSVARTQASRAGAVTSSSEPLCTFPDQAELWADATADDGPPAFTRWLTDEAGTRTTRALQRVVARFGDALEGSVADHVGQVMVVVTDPSQHVDAQQVVEAVRAIEPSFAVSVRPGCRPMAELTETVRAIGARDWSPDAKRSTFSAWIDLGTGRVVVGNDERSVKSESVAVALRERFGDAVVVTPATAGSRAGRYDDDNPHHGAAAIHDGAASCTANAPVVGIYGIRFAAVAGHCVFASSQTEWHSGPYGYGYEVHLASDFPTHDYGLLAPFSVFGDNYTNRIHTEPLSASRIIVGAVDPWNGATACMSGRTSHASCGFVVNRDDEGAMFCDLLGCTSYLSQAYTPIGAPKCASGDSGAPFYFNYGADAVMGGLFVAFIDVPYFGVRNCLYHEASEIQGAVGNYLTVP